MERNKWDSSSWFWQISDRGGAAHVKMNRILAVQSDCKSMLGGVDAYTDALFFPLHIKIRVPPNISMKCYQYIIETKEPATVADILGYTRGECWTDTNRFYALPVG